ncbi:PAS domain S-box [Salinarchaeum sp. Harcht-Bsk1]|uniref:hybrid sensor histidine kinase/response regulator n=1 Tax=Salinarchaeum sp. Harcht-Bsk1 TaxID=1333523 RepID=UPI0003423449|nr:PAS domain S-box protein [Salinarchaeum sp. Harcht-Bsk1]AGN02432.1 PAS domain S-box [Salinarchaeum sp. Harcht-Bsk1]
MVASFGRNTTFSSPPGDEEPISILHVDDNVDFGEMAATFIERNHDRFDVEVAASATEGLERLAEADVDCIVSDYEMPGMNGLEFLEAVREEHPGLPFILFTGKGSEDVASEAISAGVTDYLQKKSGSDQFTVLANRIENAVTQARAEHRLEESQRRFRTLLSNVPGMAYRCRNERGWPMRFVSDGCAELTGYERSDLVDGEVSYGRDVVHPDDRDRVWESVQDAVAAREPFRVEYRIRTADGAEKWVWEQGQGVFEDGEPVAVEGFITDVTDRKESQERLEYQSSLLEAQMETTIDGLLIVDEDRTVVSYNDRFAEMWEIPEELVGAESEGALLDWAVENKVAEPEAFRDHVEKLYEGTEETSRDEVRLTDGRVFDRYSAPVIGDDGTNYGRLWVFRDITERKEHEQELERKEFLFGRVQEIADVGVWELDPETDDLTWSDGIRHIHGVPDDYEPNLEDAIDFYHPDDRDDIASAVTRAIEDGEEYDLELRIVRPDGTVRDIRARGEVSTDEHGETDLVRGVFQDITEQKERERKLQIYEYACRSALSGIAIANFDGELRSVNPAFCEMWGYEEKADVVGRSVTDFWDECNAATSVVDAVKETGSWEGELKAVRDDGTTFDAYSSASYVTNDEGESIALMSSFVDVTDRKRRERELEEEREKYATLVEQSHDGVLIIQNAEFVFVNSRLAAITGYKEAELRGMTFADIIAPEERRRIQERYERRLDGDADSPPSRYTLTFETKEGRERVAEVSAARIQYEGAPADLASVRDVTDREQYEDRLERLNEKLQVLNRVVRHDIRNDMAIMLGWGEQLEAHVDDAGAEHLEKILTSGEHIVELTEIARDYVETLTSEEEVDLKPTRLQQVLANEIALRREAHPDAEISVDAPVPDVAVRANEMLSSVFRNLLNNAVQHNDEDTPMVEIGAEEREDDVSVAIADNGPGIPEAQRERIFGRGEMSLESSGTGIGLYLVQTLVDQYGGDVRVEDNEPEGAVFTVTLPKVD